MNRIPSRVYSDPEISEGVAHEGEGGCSFFSYKTCEDRGTSSKVNIDNDCLVNGKTDRLKDQRRVRKIGARTMICCLEKTEEQDEDRLWLRYGNPDR